MKSFYVFTVALVAASVGAIIGAFYLQVATRVVAGFKPSYGNAYSASFIGGFIFAAAVGVGCLAGVIPTEPWLQVNLLTVLLFFVVHLCVYSGQLVHPDYGYVGMGRASIIVLMQNVIAIVAWSVGCWALHKPAPLDHLGPQVAALQLQPRTYSSPQQAQTEAVRRYPDLGVEGSKLHREFLSRYRRYQSENPAYFQKSSWPVDLAEEVVEATRLVGIGEFNHAGTQR